MVPLNRETKCRTLLLLFCLMSSCIPLFLFLDHKCVSESFIHEEAKCTNHLFIVQPLEHGRLLKQEKDQYNSHGQYSEQSFTLSLQYMDQATWGAKRVRSLQCWAAQLKRIMRVVEPSMNNTYLGAPVRKPVDGILKFRDVFDIQWWNHYGEEQAGFLPLVSWEEFFLHAPRKTILVQIVYRQDAMCFEDSLQNKTGCNWEDSEVTKFWMKNLWGFSFQVIRRVCIDFNDLKKVITIKKFNKYIFGKTPLNVPVTVVFNEWRGPLREAHFNKRENNCILRIRDPKCSPSGPTGIIHNITMNALRPNLKIFHSAEAYIAKYLTGNSGYIAIMVRWELMFLEHIYHTLEDPPPLGKNCSEEIREYVLTLRQTKGLSTAFLATDVGRYGSKILHHGVTLYNISYYESGKNLTEELLETLYGRPITLEQYDQQFDEFSGTSTHPTYYVPQLQKAIAAKAECLLLVGWGSFHENTLDLYKKLHKGKECYEKIPRC